MNEETLATATFDPKVRYYWLLSGTWVLALTLVGLPLILLWIPIGLIASGHYLKRLSCILTTRSLKVRTGAFNRVEKTVPLDKITDLALRQGPIMRLFDLEGLSVETAGMSGPGSVVALDGIEDARQFRDAVLAQRDRVTLQMAGSPSPADSAETTESVLAQIRDSLHRIEARLGSKDHQGT